MTQDKQVKYKLYKLTRKNYVETAKSLMRGAEYLGEVTFTMKKEESKK